MEHVMKLQSEPFAKIKSGAKDIEMRLYDEKRRKISVGDVVVFCHTETGEKLTCSVKAMHRYPDFAALYATFDKRRIGYDEWETADPKDMEAYYPIEEIARYGVVGIEIEVIKGRN